MKVPVVPADSVHLQFLAKQFVAAEILMLLQNGKVNGRDHAPLQCSGDRADLCLYVRR
jgi:hypothetical protein